MTADVIYLTEKLIVVQKIKFSCFEWFLWAFKVLRGVSNTYHSVSGPRGHHGNAFSLAFLFPAFCRAVPLYDFNFKMILLQGP